MGAGSRRRALRRLAILGASLLVSLAVCEAVLRWAGGYRLWSPRLERIPGAAVPEEDVGSVVGAFLESTGGTGIDTAWFHESPQQVERGAVLPEHEEAWQRYGEPPVYYVYNRNLLQGLFGDPERLAETFSRGLPERMAVFTAGTEGPFPRYRYPVSVTLPTGLPANSLGFRGKDLPVDKPERTLRLACVGASTTVSSHHLRWSYPELLQHWLQRWLDARGTELRVEVVNAGREALTSQDIAAVVRHEVLPLAVDYVIYYEGANQFFPFGLFRTPDGEAVTRTKPPPGTLPYVAGVTGGEPGLGEVLARHSAIGERLRSLLSPEAWREPAKPPVRRELPPVGDLSPASLEGVLGLSRILTDLERIRDDCTGRGARLVLCTFSWMVQDGMELDPKQRAMFAIVNTKFWPLTYADVRAATDLQNAVFARWADARSTDLVDVASRMPAEPRLFNDPIHNTQSGVRVRAWCVFERLTEILARDLDARRVPVADSEPGTAHPARRPPEHLSVPQ